MLKVPETVRIIENRAHLCEEACRTVLAVAAALGRDCMEGWRQGYGGMTCIQDKVVKLETVIIEMVDEKDADTC